MAWKLRREISSGKIILGSYENPHWSLSVNTWVEVPNFTFEDTIHFTSLKSAHNREPYAYFTGTDQVYSFLYRDLNLMIPYMVNGVVSGKFTFIKHGKMVTNAIVSLVTNIDG